MAGRQAAQSNPVQARAAQFNPARPTQSNKAVTV